MKAAAVNGFGSDLEIRVGTEDAEVAARRLSSSLRLNGGRLIVHTTSTPRWADQEPVHIRAVFQVLAPGRVRWEFAQAGRSEDGV